MTLKAIFHIDEQPKWDLLLNNVHNLIVASGSGEADVEVLANAEAVLGYVTDGRVNVMQDLAAAGVRFVACRNALDAREITEERLPSFVTVVPAGVVELVQRQHEGYVYIRP